MNLLLFIWSVFPSLDCELYEGRDYYYSPLCPHHLA